MESNTPPSASVILATAAPDIVVSILSLIAAIAGIVPPSMFIGVCFMILGGRAVSSRKGGQPPPSITMLVLVGVVSGLVHYFATRYHSPV